MHRIAFVIATLIIVCGSPAWAGGEIVITQAKALAGNVTPGDAAGFPVTLTVPGKYLFESNLTVPGGQWGIVVNAHNVDIDMDGYLLSGNGQGDYGLVSGYGESRIHDGVINTFKASGLYLRNNAWIIEDVQIVRNARYGIDATGARFIEVRNSLVAANGISGIVTGDSGVVRDSIVSSNGSAGLSCEVNCSVYDSSFEKNAGFGVILLSGIVIGNTIMGSGGYGFVDREDIDVGFGNNILIGNNKDGSSYQRSGGVDLHPNGCVGKPC